MTPETIVAPLDAGDGVGTVADTVAIKSGSTG